LDEKKYRLCVLRVPRVFGPRMHYVGVAHRRYMERASAMFFSPLVYRCSYLVSRSWWIVIISAKIL